ncbi:MAG: hypothetical protein FJ303_23325 [Planctomycetes bacterium]|nr:hypothetical protein [Planctomycetota bacterium]
MNNSNEPLAFSNAVRLSAGQWLGIAIFAIAFVVAAPSLWNRYEEFTPDADYRIPLKLRQDYWLFERYAGLAAREYEAVILGDSVMWGEYVLRGETLSHYLNQQAGKPQFANLGLGAAHPLALAGLIEHYSSGVRNATVILHCNPLWLSNPKADLQDPEFKEFAHPDLVPQFWPHLPPYPVPWFPDNPDDKQKISQRLGIVVEQRVPFNKWTRHLQHAYYGGESIPSWTLQHPYDNPLEPMTRGLPVENEKRRYEVRPWYKDRKREDYPWVDMGTSLQWPAFQRAVEILKGRGNRVFVIVGPLNEHMMTPASLGRYQKVKATISAWLAEKQVPHIVATVLPSEVYGDASHPFAAGYEMLARQLREDPTFREMIR